MYDVLYENVKYEIIIPTYNREKLLELTIHSALKQDFDKAYLVTVIDDNPKENNATENLIKDKFRGRVRYFRNKKNLGLFGNWNASINVSIGDYLIMLHDDDMLMENYLKTIDKVISTNIKFGILSSNPLDIDALGNILPINKFAKIRAFLSKRLLKNKLIKINENRYQRFNPHNICAIVFNINEIRQDLYWNEDQFPSADFYLNYELSKKYSNYKIPDHVNLCYYRWHENVSTKSDVIQKTLVNDYKFYTKIYEKKSGLFKVFNKWVLDTIYKLKLLSMKNNKISEKVSSELDISLRKPLVPGKLWWLTLGIIEFIYDLKNSEACKYYED